MAAQRQLPQRDFKKEFNDKIAAIMSTDSIYDGTNQIKSFGDIADLMLNKLANMKATIEFPIDLFAEIATGADKGVEHVTMLNMSKYLNILAACTPDELNTSVQSFILVHNDILKIIGNYNEVIEPIRAEVAEVAKKYGHSVPKA